MKGVYCVDIVFTAVPISRTSKLMKINKRVDDLPLAIDENNKPLNTRFLKYFIDRKNIDKYRIKYEIIVKKFLSGICYKE
jgi:hypothetical protein